MVKSIHGTLRKVLIYVKQKTIICIGFRQKQVFLHIIGAKYMQKDRLKNCLSAYNVV